MLLLLTAALAAPLAQWLPVGQVSCGPGASGGSQIPGINVDPALTTRPLFSRCSGWYNTNVLPHGYVTLSSTPDTSEYLQVGISSPDTVTFERLDVWKRGSGGRQASIRSSLDGYTADLDVVALAATSEVVSLDLSSLGTRVAPDIDFRVYYYDATSNAFADVNGSGAAEGVRLHGEVSSELYLDADGDGFGDPSMPGTGASYVPSGTDCDDGDAAVNPGQVETCNGVDDNCIGGIDEGYQSYPYYPDSDGDGFGEGIGGYGPSAGDGTLSCSGVDEDLGVIWGPELRTGTTSGAGDDWPNNSSEDVAYEFTAPYAGTWTFDTYGSSYDTRLLIYDGCNTILANNDDWGTTDDGDRDDNGVPEETSGLQSFVSVGLSAGQTVIVVVEGFSGSVGDFVLSTQNHPAAAAPPLPAGMTCGTVPPGFTLVFGDCDDGSASSHPGATEICDGEDNDCNGAADFGGGGQEVDADNDAWFVCDGDCRDLDFNVNPGEPEVCDGRDNDCSNGGFVEADEEDGDGDGYALCDLDCDDADYNRNPGQPEVCDGVDNDCFGGADDGLSFEDRWPDADADGYGDLSSSPTFTCSAPPGTVANGDDCDDGNPFRNPSAIEACDGVDNDCDGQIDDGVSIVDWFPDLDGDGYGSGATTGNACASPNPGDVSNNSDCDDGDPTVRPGASEVCDAVDHDCDGQAENGLPQVEWHADADGDGYGDALGAAVTGCSGPSGSVADGTDCDDSTAAVSPAAFEVCDGVDNDCNGFADVDDGLPSQVYYEDPDLDGWGSGLGVEACQPMPTWVTLLGDCDETDATLNPGRAEICDGVDNDCDGVIDDGIPSLEYWEDLDGDGFGDGSPLGSACITPAGFARVGGDCDDADSTSYPGAVEQCDSIDNDCNLLVDDDVSTTAWFVDADGDRFGGVFAAEDCLQPVGTVANDLDCDDDAATGADVHPDAVEVCDGIDNDCDGAIDDDDPGLLAALYFPDADMDGFGDSFHPGASACSQPFGTSPNALDCADGDVGINPVVAEACPDGIDNDCDGLIDAADPSYTDQPVVFWFDQDGDGAGTPTLSYEACSGEAPLGYVSPASGLDCNDGAFVIRPGALELCDGFDNDCDGVVDQGLVFSDYWPDADGDGFGDDLASPLSTCDPAAADDLGMVSQGGDCDDTAASVNPDAPEVCNNVDDDCDGTPDDGLLELWFPDGDGDGFGAADLGMQSCSPDPGSVMMGQDCDDSDVSVNPDMPETCSGADSDCNGVVDDAPDAELSTFFADADSDGLGDPEGIIRACVRPSEAVVNSDDCDDSDPDVGRCGDTPIRRRGGCTCDHTAPGGLWLLLVGLAARRRRA